MKKSKTFSMMSIGLKLFKRIPVLSFIHVVMDLLSSVLKSVSGLMGIVKGMVTIKGF